MRIAADIKKLATFHGPRQKRGERGERLGLAVQFYGCLAIARWVASMVFVMSVSNNEHGGKFSAARIKRASRWAFEGMPPAESSALPGLDPCSL